jgi:hypothetical protein
MDELQVNYVKRSSYAWVAGHFADGRFADGHFAEWTVCRK